MSVEDLFVLAKLFDIEGLIDYRAILDDKIGNGILQFIKPLPIPHSKELILEKPVSKTLQQSNLSQ